MDQLRCHIVSTDDGDGLELSTHLGTCSHKVVKQAFDLTGTFRSFFFQAILDRGSRGFRFHCCHGFCLFFCQEFQDQIVQFDLFMIVQFQAHGDHAAQPACGQSNLAVRKGADTASVFSTVMCIQVSSDKVLGIFLAVEVVVPAKRIAEFAHTIACWLHTPFRFVAHILGVRAARVQCFDIGFCC